MVKKPQLIEKRYPMNLIIRESDRAMLLVCPSLPGFSFPVPTSKRPDDCMPLIRSMKAFHAKAYAWEIAQQMPGDPL